MYINSTLVSFFFCPKLKILLVSALFACFINLSYSPLTFLVLTNNCCNRSQKKGQKLKKWKRSFESVPSSPWRRAAKLPVREVTAASSCKCCVQLCFNSELNFSYFFTYELFTKLCSCILDRFQYVFNFWQIPLNIWDCSWF